MQHSPEEREPQNDESHSCFYQTVTLGEWWLTKSDNSLGESRLAVAGFSSSQNGAKRCFNSAPIWRRHDAFTLETVDHIWVILRGVINISRTISNGFSSQVPDLFLFGFPLSWEKYAVHRADNDLNDDGNIIGGNSCSASNPNNSKSTDQKEIIVGLCKTSGNQSPRKKKHSNQSCQSYEEKAGSKKSAVSEDVPKGCTKEAKISKQGKVRDALLKLIKESREVLSPSVQQETKRATRSNPNFKFKDGVNENQTKPASASKSKRATKVAVAKKEINIASSSTSKNGHKVNSGESTASGGRKLSSSRPSNKKKDEQTPKHEEVSRMGKRFHSADSMSVKRSRSGRILLPSLEFWRNQIPVYDADRNVTGIEEECPSS